MMMMVVRGGERGWGIGLVVERGGGCGWRTGVGDGEGDDGENVKEGEMRADI